MDYATRPGQQLKKAKLIVTQKLHQVHLRQKAQYDKGRRHQKFKVGTSVLIYKPIRKFGKSEKLLHRWLGPYEVIRRITDLNFEVLLKTKTGKSEIIHTVAMKKFYPTVPQPEDHTAQPNDNIREEQPNSPKTQPSNEIQKRKPGRPRKLQEITPLSESEPKEEVQASSNMRPMRTRKKPARFRIIHALILGISIAMAEPPITEGVYFAKWPSTIFTDSEWIITTELTFTDAFKTIGALFTHLHNRIWNTTFITKTNIASHLQIHQDPSATQIVLTNYAQKRTNDTLRVLEAISQRLNDIVGAMGIKPPTKVLPTAPRGLINLGGDALKWLFGTPINNDLERLNQKLLELHKDGVDIVHSIEDQATVISENLHQTTLNTGTQVQVRNVLGDLDKQLAKLKKQEHTALELHVPTIPIRL